MRSLFRNFRLVDELKDELGSVLVEDGRIAAILPPDVNPSDISPKAGPFLRVFDGQKDKGALALLPAFVETHAHFRDPGWPEKETVESGSLAAAAGGYGSVVCMANTDPVMDDPAAAAALKARSDSLGFIDLYPALAATRGLGGKDYSHLDREVSSEITPVVSDDGKDVADAAVFTAVFKAAAARGLLVSCHCDLGSEAEAVRRALSLAKEAGAPVHIAHVSTRESVEAVRAAKRQAALGLRPRVSAEATPHHLALTDADAKRLGLSSFGRVHPPLASEADREALIDALYEGTIDVIATDHAPHTKAAKEAGAPGFIGLESAFAVCHTLLCEPEGATEDKAEELAGRLKTGLYRAKKRFSLSALSALMSAVPARVLGLKDRGLLRVDLRADFALIDLDAVWTVDERFFLSRSSNSPFIGRRLRGRVTATIHGGRVVYDGAL